MLEETAKDKAPVNKNELFTWQTGTKFEKICFILSCLFLVSAIFFLVMEFVNESSAWPYTWFDLTIAGAFIFEGLAHFRHKRSFGIITLVVGAVFLVLGTLKLIGIL